MGATLIISRDGNISAAIGIVPGATFCPTLFIKCVLLHSLHTSPCLHEQKPTVQQRGTWSSHGGGPLELFDRNTTNTAAYPADATMVCSFEALERSDTSNEKMTIQTETVIRWDRSLD